MSFGPVLKTAIRFRIEDLELSLCIIDEYEREVSNISKIQH